MKKLTLAVVVGVMFAMFATVASADMCEYHQWKMKPCKAGTAESVRSTDLCKYYQWKMKRCKTEKVAPAPVVAEKPIVLEGVYFDTAKATIKPESKVVLDDNVKKLKKRKNLNIAVVGYTDNVGNEKYNQKLSESRAIAVKDYFVQNGIPEDRIVAVGKGPANPIADNSTPEGRAKNRRIEIEHN